MDPKAYLHHVLTHIAEHPIDRINELLPWTVAPQLSWLISHFPKSSAQSLNINVVPTIF
ncbi:transposase domain-containing protein [Paraburkholderia phytofirmans]|uniref:transposase domain-containing protein n=1 Tax=Paraburkholderia phytofirmans TaxID=261302 RepID=UPI0038BC92F3